MKKKNVIIIVVAVVVLLGALAVGVASENDFFSRYGELGKKHQQTEAEDTSETAIQGESFSITTVEYNNLVEDYVFSGNDEATSQKRALEILIEKYTMFNLAKEKGYVVDDAYLDDLIKTQKEDISKADNASDFYDYLDGRGMTEDEYWQSEYENLRMWESIGAYKQALQEQYLKDNQCALTDEGVSEKWDAYYDDIVVKAVKDENVKVSFSKIELDKDYGITFAD